MTRALIIIATLISSLLLSFFVGRFSKKCERIETVVIEKKVDTVWIEKPIIVDTIKQNPGCKTIVVTDTIFQNDTTVIVDTVWEVQLRQYVFKDTILTAKLWANYVDTSSFRYTLRISQKPVIMNSKSNYVFAIFERDGTVVEVGYSRLVMNRFLIGGTWSPVRKSFGIKVGVGF